MKVLSAEVPFSAWMIGIMKLGFIGLGVIIGALFQDFWMPILIPIGVISAVALAWTSVHWIAGVRAS